MCLATKDYAPGFVCRNCRNRARCKCGGLLSLKEKGSATCSICDVVLSDWRCVECPRYPIPGLSERSEEGSGGDWKSFPGRRVDTEFKQIQRPSKRLMKNA